MKSLEGRDAETINGHATNEITLLAAGQANPGLAMNFCSSGTWTQCRLVNGFGWQGMASPLDPLLQRRLRQLSSPERAAHSSRGKKAAWPPSSTHVPAVPVQRAQAPAINQPSRPRWARVRPT
ncbi:hypothetical protein [Novosphingobium jiangmenense]|uniref:Uncharacterized protein n=1 Tax=Novosphingobium jiangmenense TaxID=2791981 RepID=A0ABS0HI76_9SPHN|nr:hypothetical protein [Novosphingobium jiangmenense]MBF9151689.1 hypothetical protein [Novosphingobium jiangmenense]